MRALVCGISGQDGAYLAELLLRKGYTVITAHAERNGGKRCCGFLERLGAGDEIGFRIELRDRAPCSRDHQAHEPFSRHTVDLFGGLRDLNGAQKIDGVPTLIVQGRHDRTRTPEHGAEMASQIGGAQLFVLEGSGHTPQIEEPEAFWEVALPFLAGKT